MNASARERDLALRADAESGRAFVIETGGDGGGGVDVYVDEPLPELKLPGLRRCGGEHLLHLPSGQLLVGGAEDHRSANPGITDATSIVRVPPGDYAIACFAHDGETSGDFDASKLPAVLGVADHAYYKRISRLSLCGYALILVFFLLRPEWGWKWSLAATVALVAGYFWVQEEWVLKRNERYQSILRRVNEHFKASNASSTPTLILSLRRVTDEPTLRGGVVKLNA